MEKKYNAPMITWLKVTDYMTGWLESELGGAAVVKEQHVVCVLHLQGAREVMKMESIEDIMDGGDIGYAISATRRNCIEAGMRLDPEEVKRIYGITREQLQLYVPIECPQMCMTKDGVLRPWRFDITFGREQANALLKLLREEFWKSVALFDKDFATGKHGKRYTAKEMIEAFCVATKTSDVYLDTIRREWQRRVKRAKN